MMESREHGGAAAKLIFQRETAPEERDPLDRVTQPGSHSRGWNLSPGESYTGDRGAQLPPKDFTTTLGW